MATCECCGQEIPEETKLEAGVDKAAWEKWLDYRKKIKKPLKPVSYELAQTKLAKFGDNQMAVVEQSMSNGWQGLFGLRDGNEKDKPARKLSLGERATEHRKRAERIIAKQEADDKSMGEDDAHIRPPLDIGIR